MSVQAPTSIDTFAKLCIGGASATVGVLLGLPFNNCKARLQLGDDYKKVASYFVKHPARLLSGTLPMTASVFPATAISYVVDAYAKDVLFAKRSPSPVEKTVLATMAGACSSIVATPSELIFVKMASNRTGVSETVFEVYKESGIKGFFHGFSPTTARIACFTGAYLGLGEEAPVTATLLGTILTNPVDGWKTVSQAEGKKANWQEILQFIRKNGHKGFCSRLISYAIFMGSAPKVKTFLEDVSR